MQERENLVARNLDAVQETTQTKLQLFEQLETLENHRQHLLEASGLSPDTDGMARLCRRLPAGEQLEDLWQQNLEQLKLCRETNLINGGILELGRIQAEQALAILRGQVGETRLYSAAGDTTRTLGHRELGKA